MNPLDLLLLEASTTPHGLAVQTRDAQRLHTGLWNRRARRSREEPFASLSIARSPRAPDTEVWIVHKDRDRRGKGKQFPATETETETAT